MDGAFPDQQSTETQDTQQQKIPSNSPKKGSGLLKAGIFEIFFVGVVLVLLFGILNYFNILSISTLWPNQLGWLPHRLSQQSRQSNNVTIVPTIAPSASLLEPAKQTLMSFLPTILTPSLLANSSSGITLTEDKTSPQSFIASWKTKEKNIDSSVHMSQDLKKIIAVDFYVKDSELLSSISRETTESKATQIFSIKPKGIWGCKNAILETMLYCENFWEQSENSKRGLGALIVTSPAGNRIVYYLCEHTNASDLYSWKSCRPEFLKNGVQ